MSARPDFSSSAAQAAAAASDSSSEFVQLTSKPASFAAAATPAVSTDSVRVARFHGFNLDDEPLVSGVAARSGHLLPARSIVELRTAMVGAQVVLAFEGGDPDKPIIMGVIQPTHQRTEARSAALSARVDDDRVVISGEKEVVLQCGSASITLTRAGKVLIQGSYVLSRSTGYNKIKGAAVDIN